MLCSEIKTKKNNDWQGEYNCTQQQIEWFGITADYCNATRPRQGVYERFVEKTHENSDSFAGNVNQMLQIPVCWNAYLDGVLRKAASLDKLRKSENKPSAKQFGNIGTISLP